MSMRDRARTARLRAQVVTAGCLCCVVAASVAGCAAKDPDTPGPTASAQAQAVADAFVARANEAVDTGRTLQQAVADAQSAGQRASGGFITQPLYVSDEGSADGFHETIAVVNDRGVCYSFTVALGSTHVTGTGVSVMDACPPTAS